MSTTAPPEPVREPAFYARRKKRANELCQILIRSGDLSPEQARRALRAQRERGGQIGRILVKMGACSEATIAAALRTQLQLATAAGKAPNLAKLARANPSIAGIELACRPGLTSLTVFACDALVLGAIAGLAATCDQLVAHHLSPGLLHYGFPALLLCVLALAVSRAYAPIARSAPDEIRVHVEAVTLVFVFTGLAVVFRWERLPWHLIAILVFEWLIACVVMPIARALVRRRFSRYGWWGVPAVVLGAGKMGRRLVSSLRARPQYGLRPVLILDDDASKHGTLRATLHEDDEIRVDSFRDVPVASVATVDLPSSNSLHAETGAESVRPQRVHDLVNDSAPYTIRGSMLATPIGGGPDSAPRSMRFPADTMDRASALPGAAKVLADASHSSASASDFRTPGASPAPRTASGLHRAVGEPPPPSLRSQEPSWIRKAPESLRGYVRGAFAEVEGVPIVGSLALAPLLAKRLGISYAILAMPGQSARRIMRVTERVGGTFSHLLVIPNLLGLASMDVPARDVGGVVGIEVRQQLLLPGPRFAKRLMDLALTLLGGIFVLPIILLLALLIRLDSPGPALYPQKRLGRGGTTFTAMKFRSMYGDGEARLKAVLESNPAMRAEYEEFHKLSNDPRITRLGRILRKYSLDELPQLWNVVRGDMSLVGPRPYLEREIPDMSDHERIILRAPPGMTGLWQVSDRNATGFEERLRMDVHYVRNWSPWLDLYILARTFGVVIGGTGA